MNLEEARVGPTFSAPGPHAVRGELAMVSWPLRRQRCDAG